ncbi:hypothetical protein KP509_1Z096200 [Ceratopteris richardii]|nr:hypothetical protein KP509_1Z096200 [Ceratopteris richardii]
MAHMSIAVGIWLSYGGGPPDCTGCGFDLESQRHCLWDCQLAQQIWRQVLWLLNWWEDPQTIIWAFVAWGSHADPSLCDEHEVGSMVLLVQDGRVDSTHDLHTPPWSGVDEAYP